MAASENTVLVSFSVQLRSKQIVPWTFLPVDRTMSYRVIDIFDDLKDHYALHTANKKEMVKK